MQNVSYKVEKDVLTITVNLKQTHGLSSSGNTVIVGGTQGNVKIGVDDIAMGVTVYTKKGLDKLRLEKAKDAGFATWAEYQKAINGK